MSLRYSRGLPSNDRYDLTSEVHVRKNLPVGDASETCTPRSRTRVARTEETTTSQCRDYRVGRTVSFIPVAPADRRHIKKPATCPARRAETVVVHPSLPKTGAVFQEGWRSRSSFFLVIRGLIWENQPFEVWFEWKRWIRIRHFEEFVPGGRPKGDVRRASRSEESSFQGRLGTRTIPQM